MTEETEYINQSLLFLGIRTSGKESSKALPALLNLLIEKHNDAMVPYYTQLFATHHSSALSSPWPVIMLRPMLAMITRGLFCTQHMHGVMRVLCQ